MQPAAISLTDLHTVTVESLEPGAVFMFAHGRARQIAIRLNLDHPDLISYLVLSDEEYLGYRVLRGNDRLAKCVRLPLAPLKLRLLEKPAPHDAGARGNVLVGAGGAWVAVTANLAHQHALYISLQEWTVGEDFPDYVAAFDAWELVAGDCPNESVIARFPPNA